MLTPPKCSCAVLLIGDSVFTCPECVGAAIRFRSGERVDQAELFEYLDRDSSMRGLARGSGDLIHISEVLSPYLEEDGLPF